MQTSSNRLARKADTKNRLEIKLKEYELPIRYLRSVVIWQRPIDFGVLLALLWTVFWVYSYLDMTVLTMVSLFTVFYVLFEFAIYSVNVVIPWNQLVPPTDVSNSTAQLDQVIALIVNTRFFLSDAFEDIKAFRITSPAKYAIQVIFVNLLLAWIGSLASGFWLLFILSTTLLLIPGVISNGIPALVYQKAEPYLLLVKGIVTEKLTIVLEFIQLKIAQITAKGRSLGQLPEDREKSETLKKTE
eukprot:TRINITY_DN5560_c0_g1_i1.p1 TRINITY_DN5560_c0_g1~~TRINITY_DN5560_c0_g1_i1.p1  ORF type:complete len:244 (+),score=29.86 TRINITY_DN5560_c0_g1_i1:203-934(+)